MSNGHDNRITLLDHERDTLSHIFQYVIKEISFVLSISLKKEMHGNALCEGITLQKIQLLERKIFGEKE